MTGIVGAGVADRHAGDLGGRLEAFDPTRAVTVLVHVASHAATQPVAQHLAWMLVNILARAEGIVAKVIISCPEDVLLAQNVVPFGVSPLLGDRLVEAGRSVGVVAVTTHGGRQRQRVDGEHSSRVDHVIVVSDVPSDAPSGSASTVTYAWATSWWGGVSAHAPHPRWGLRPSGVGPVGAYTAAAFATARVFLSVRLPGGTGAARAAAYGWDMFSQRSDAVGPIEEQPLGSIDIECVGLAGVGAVGCAWLHTLWAHPNVRGTCIAADNDAEGVTTSNLNRGVLFRRVDLGVAKATIAARVLQRSDLGVEPFQGDFAAAGRAVTLLVSAVDKNASRASLQASYPARSLSASTRDLRSEVLRCGPPGVGACLRCYNAPEPVLSDAAARALALDSRDTAILGDLARESGMSTQDVEAVLRRGSCDSVGDELLARLHSRLDVEVPEFSVGFTSVMAGVMLAAETIKVLSGAPMAGNTQATSAAIQFMRPDSPVNVATRLSRDASCPACDPEHPGVAVWARRAHALPAVPITNAR